MSFRERPVKAGNSATPNSHPRNLPSLPRLYPIVDVEFCASRSLDPVDLAEACLRGGARLLQLRAKSGGSAAFVTLAERVVAAARPYAATVVVNDRADIARLAAAGGVHVGQEDLAVEDVRRIVGPAALVGLSTHSEQQVDLALATTADYIAVGPVFGTATKETGYTARGLDLVRYAAGRGKPIVAIGGITLERVPDVLAAGASAVAVITDLLTGGDPSARTRQFLRCASRLDPRSSP